MPISSSPGQWTSRQRPTFFCQLCMMEMLTRWLVPPLLPHFRPFQGLPLVRWLSNQRNALGGFSSTQDTVIALQALAAYAQVSLF